QGCCGAIPLIERQRSYHTAFILGPARGSVGATAEAPHGRADRGVRASASRESCAASCRETRGTGERGRGGRPQSPPLSRSPPPLCAVTPVGRPLTGGARGRVPPVA